MVTAVQRLDSSAGNVQSKSLNSRMFSELLASVVRRELEGPSDWNRLYSLSIFSSKVGVVFIWWTE